MKPARFDAEDKCDPYIGPVEIPPCPDGEHEWDAGGRWGVIIGVSRCKKCGTLSRKEYFA